MRVQILRWLPRVLAVIAVALIAFAIMTTASDNVPILKTFQSDRNAFADLLVALAGWLLTLAGLLFAGQEAKRGMAFNALLKLHEDEGAPEQGKAKQLIWQAAPPRNYAGNVYSYVRNYVYGLPERQREDLDQARRRLTNFWYAAERLVELGSLEPRQIFESVGPPDILGVLEPLEAIKAEGIDSEWRSRPWLPMRLLIAWYKQQGQRKEARLLSAEVPAKPSLYEASRKEQHP